tara:strand:+ start:516 stop:704 length:189 start_codon:yes stop_codon:yes gene_type:complete
MEPDTKELEELALKLWKLASKIASGGYETRALSERECRLLYEIVRASKNIAKQDEYIKKLRT